MTEAEALWRMAAFRKLDQLRFTYGGSIPWAALADGFGVDGDRKLHFGTTAEGIFRPKGFERVLSIKTVVPNKKGRVWYRDQMKDPTDGAYGDTISYSFTGSDPSSRQNPGAFLLHA
jgi:hypothetical protein